jgi:hypothetical protein
MIEIWNPRWHDKIVLIAKYKVISGINKIKFTKSGCLKDKIFEIDGAIIRSYPTESNGTILCYAVPLDKVIGEQKEPVSNA